MARRKELTKLFTVCPQKHSGDCSISALAMAFNLSYEELLVIAARVIPDILTRGVLGDEMHVIARQFNRELRQKTPCNFAKDRGLLMITYPDATEHVVFMTNGLIFEPTSQGDVWDAREYVKHWKCKTQLYIVEGV